ncbi:MAG: hypothetical protein ACHQYQ_01345 [Bacteriovoracales bacterium]
MNTLIAGENFPNAIYLRTAHKSYNEKYNFLVANGKLWISKRLGDKVVGPWNELPFHKDLKNPMEISADSDHLIVVDQEGKIFSTRKALENDIKKIQGTTKWGPPLWLGPGMHMPPNVKSWAISFLSPREDKYWVDPGGNKQGVGQGVSTIFALDKGGQTITYLDPWLARDYSYQLCTPVNGRFQAESISSSGSTHFIINRFGDMYVQTFDFDISGADPVFFKYTYDPTRGKGPRKDPNILSGFVSRRVIPIEGWIRQPKIQGTITDKISIYRKGFGVVNRVLRVEGAKDGINGFFQRETQENLPWIFVPTGLPLEGNILNNSSNDHTLDSLGIDQSSSFAGVLSDGTKIRIPNFNSNCTPSDLIISIGGDSLKLRLHSHHLIRFLSRAAGLTNEDLNLGGAIEIPLEVLANLKNQSSFTQKFIKDNFGNERFSEFSMKVNLNEMAVKGKKKFNWELKRSR